jgi:hypothetical protein
MRRVDTVRLAARSEALVRRGALLLEDALRTASFPEAGPGRVLFIRSLRVGVIHSYMPPSSLALALEQRVRELAVSAVHAADPSAAHRDAVFFRDDAEPSTALAVGLVQGEPLDAWFWPLAVPGFSTSQPRDEALRLVLSHALQTSAGPAAVVRIVEAVHAARGLELLLASLRWQEGPVLLRAFGGMPPSPPIPEPPDSTGEGLTSVPMREAVKRWVVTWGTEDARTIWLTAVALVLGRRGRLADVRLPEQAARVAARLSSEPAVRVTRARGPDAPIPPLAPARKSTGAAPPPGTPAPPVEQHTPPPASPIPKTATEALVIPPPRTTAPEAPSEAAGPREAAPGATAVQPSNATTSVDAPIAEPEPTEQDVTLEPAPMPRSEWPEEPRPTSVAGLLLLVRILERLGLAELLEEQPALAELDLAERLLAYIAERLGATVMDPSRVLFGSHAQDPRPVRCPFRLPESLRAQVAAEGAPRTFSSGKPLDRTVLTDASGRLPLAVTYEEAPAPELLGHGRALPTALRDEDDLGLLLRGLMTGARRWCRRHGRIGLHDLVHRPGRITATRTHVNVIFDIQQSDIRVRRLGLDIDPGWVPWLGRVVRFHYLYGEA